MKTKTITFLLFALIFFNSCNSYQYIYDNESRQRQKELQNKRSANVVGDIILMVGTAVLDEAIGTNTEYIPQNQKFKRIKLINTSSDTMFVNMLTDLEWDTNGYCDFMDIRIPPNETCRLLVPLYANYNLYYGITENSDEDELLEINTANKKRIKLSPMLIAVNPDLKEEEIFLEENRP